MTVIVTMRHVREVKYCARGTRVWFERHGLDWPAFLRDGLPCETFEATGDAMALALAKHAREQHGR